MGEGIYVAFDKFWFLKFNLNKKFLLGFRILFLEVRDEYVYFVSLKFVWYVGYV